MSHVPFKNFKSKPAPHAPFTKALTERVLSSLLTVALHALPFNMNSADLGTSSLTTSCPDPVSLLESAFGM